MKAKIILAVPTTSGPNPKGWRIVAEEVVEVEEVNESVMEKIKESVSGKDK